MRRSPAVRTCGDKREPDPRRFAETRRKFPTAGHLRQWSSRICWPLPAPLTLPRIRCSCTPDKLLTTDLGRDADGLAQQLAQLSVRSARVCHAWLPWYPCHRAEAGGHPFPNEYMAVAGWDCGSQEFF